MSWRIDGCVVVALALAQLAACEFDAGGVRDAQLQHDAMVDAIVDVLVNPFDAQLEAGVDAGGDAQLEACKPANCSLNACGVLDLGCGPSDACVCAYGDCTDPTRSSACKCLRVPTYDAERCSNPLAPSHAYVGDCPAGECKLVATDPWVWCCD